MNKRILSMLLGAMIVFSLCACGAKTGELRTDSSQVSTQEHLMRKLLKAGPKTMRKWD